MPDPTLDSQVATLWTMFNHIRGEEPCVWQNSSPISQVLQSHFFANQRKSRGIGDCVSNLHV